MKREFNVGLYQFVFSLTQALDLINPAMSNHHKRVAYTAMRISETLGYTGRMKEDIIVAAALHDIGTLSVVNSDGKHSLDSQYRQSRFGYQLLQKFQPFQHPADIVRFHHVSWSWGEDQEMEGVEVPLGSHVVHISNVVNALLDMKKPFLQQTDNIRAQLEQLRGQVLSPELIDAFSKASSNEAFWLDLGSPDLMNLMSRRMPFSTVELDLDGLLDFAELLAHIIDFRSRFTATHSSGVAATAATLGQLFGFPDVDCKRLRVAGYLHDIGKLAIPSELLEKNGALTKEEWEIVRGHPYFSYQILSPIIGLEDIAQWCGSHHERLSGKGYPFRIHHSDISLEARILAVADVFTALTENRPYREGLDQVSVVGILEKMVNNFELDEKIFKVLKANYFDVDRSRVAAQDGALHEYVQFMEGLTILDLSAARSVHLSWKARLRAFMDGKNSLTREQLFSHRDCDLGRWYYSEGRQLYGHIPEMQELEKPHEALHNLIHSLVEHYEQGRNSEAEACYTEVEPLSKRIVELLHKIEGNAKQMIVESISAAY